ncbi:MAG: hypothetical protein JO091_06240 [Acidobacteriaceae bacterium]|nr:hypothetical protein [Acidobacteriaceae bacterium]
MLDLLEEADVAPTTQAIAAVQQRDRQFRAITSRWTQLKTEELPKLNELLRQANLATVSVPSPSTQSEH